MGSSSVTVDSSSGTVKVYLLDSSGKKTLLGDTAATHRMGWSLRKRDDTRLKLMTGDAGNFEIQNGALGWVVVPEGTFVSPGGDRIVKVRATGSSVTAFIGESGPPYTDCSISSTATLPVTSSQGLEVIWTGADEAHVVGPSGKVVATLRHRTTRKEDRFR